MGRPENLSSGVLITTVVKIEAASRLFYIVQEFVMYNEFATTIIRRCGGKLKLDEIVPGSQDGWEVTVQT